MINRRHVNLVDTSPVDWQFDTSANSVDDLSADEPAARKQALLDIASANQAPGGGLTARGKALVAEVLRQAKQGGA